jgi:hypothetical protein
MRIFAFVAAVLFALPALAQLVAPLVTSDGKIACIQGMTGIGRPPGGWEAIADKTAVGGWALAETTGDSTDLHFPMCIAQQIAVRDVDASIRFKPVAGARDRAGGLVLRAQNATDYYVVVASARDNAIRIYRMQGGRRSLVASKDVPVTSGEWHKLGVLLVGDKFEISLDGKAVLTATDRSLMLPGAVGVWSQSDSVIYFDSLLLGPPTQAAK